MRLWKPSLRFFKLLLVNLSQLFWLEILFSFFLPPIWSLLSILFASKLSPRSSVQTFFHISPQDQPSKYKMEKYMDFVLTLHNWYQFCGLYSMVLLLLRESWRFRPKFHSYSNWIWKSFHFYFWPWNFKTMASVLFGNCEFKVRGVRLSSYLWV